MGLTLTTIATFIVLAVIYMVAIPSAWRRWMLFGMSVITIYILQPDIFVRWLDFFFPTLTLAITGISWLVTRKSEQSLNREDIVAIGFVIVATLSLTLLRYVDADWRWFIPSRPPPLLFVLSLVLLTIALGYGFVNFNAKLNILLGVLVLLFIILKTEILAIWMSQIIRTGTQQDVSQASMTDLNWLGFSYVAFRILHTIRDRQSGLLPELSFRDYITYVIFFPSFIAGPIDRAERFLKDLQATTEKIVFSEQYVQGFTRITIGIAKKFVIADSLAQGMALNAVNASQIETTYGAWVLLYGYAFRLYFDFSGYTDIVIGISLLFGIRLPENFAQPYLRTSITKFWQSWHITLSDWGRFYVFSPLSRYLLKRKPKPSPVLIVLVTQLATMIIIGLWHGVTTNFLIWGLWHGLGLFVHKQWTDRTRKFYRELKQKPRQQMFADVLAWFLTFHFVVLGWVWFALPEFDLALQLFAKLSGII